MKFYFVNHKYGLKFLKILYWGIVDLHCCVSFGVHTAEWFSYTYTYDTEKAMAPHSHTLAWEIPWTEEPGRLQSMGSRRVGHEWLHFHFSVLCIGEGNGNPLQCSCLENPRDGGAWWAAVYGVTSSRTRLKRLSSIHMIFFFRFFSHVGYNKVLSRVPCAM